MKSQDVKNWCMAVFYVMFVLVLISFTFSYALTDWDEVADKFAETTKELAQSVQCEIDYKDFHFKGLCSDKEIILEYMQNMTEEVSQ